MGCTVIEKKIIIVIIIIITEPKKMSQKVFCMFTKRGELKLKHFGILNV
jgi:hypothetical protein